jgi:hypothetical protein
MRKQRKPVPRDAWDGAALLDALGKLYSRPRRPLDAPLGRAGYRRARRQDDGRNGRK